MKRPRESDVQSKRKHKYGAIKTVYNGHTYDSKAEAAYAQQLDWQMAGGVIYSWTHGEVVEFPSGIKYKPDFIVTTLSAYLDGHSWTRIRYWVDVKGRETPAFRLKMRLWLVHGPGKLITVKKSGNGFKIDQEWIPGQKAPVRKRKTKRVGGAH